MRIRTIKPEWLQDDRTAALSDAAARLSVALILLANDHGKGRGHPNWICGQVWSHGQRTVTECQKAMDELAECGFVVWYQVDGQRYFEIPKWDKHQRITKRGEDRIPNNPANTTSVCGDVGQIPHFPGGILGNPDFPSSREVLGPSSYVPNCNSSNSISSTREDCALEQVTSALRVGYARRFERETKTPWMLASKAYTAIGEVARQLHAVCESQELESDYVVNRFLDRAFANESLRSKAWPWAFLAQNPMQFYGLDAPEIEWKMAPEGSRDPFGDVEIYQAIVVWLERSHPKNGPTPPEKYGLEGPFQDLAREILGEIESKVRDVAGCLEHARSLLKHAKRVETPQQVAARMRFHGVSRDISGVFETETTEGSFEESKAVIGGFN